MAGPDRDENGRFVVGNAFWRTLTDWKPGGPRRFKTPKDLWASCLTYFQWVEENPLYSDQLVVFQGSATHEPVAKMRAMTLGGLCLHIGVSDETWRGWRTAGHELHRPDLKEVIARVEAVMREQKFTGAAADLLNAGIIARDLGLADKKELTGAGGGPIQTITKEMTPQEAAEAYAATLHRDKG